MAWDHKDTITGTNRADTIEARGGIDTVKARGGNHRILGQDGDDSLDGGLGNDTLDAGSNPGIALEAVNGAAGDDTLVESAGQDRFVFGPDWGHDQISGDGDPTPGQDNDDVCFSCGTGQLTSGVTINLETGRAFDTAAGETGPNTVTWTPRIIEWAVGSAAGDTILGSSRSNIVNGQLGAHIINVSGDGGNDSAVDTVTRDQGDQILGTTCDGDTINTL